MVLEKGHEDVFGGTGFLGGVGHQDLLPIQIGSGAPAPQPGHPVATFGFFDFLASAFCEGFTD